MTPDLFSPIQLGACRLKSRIFMAPLTRSRAAKGNVPRALNALYYAQRADAGLIITEATQVSATAQGYISTPGIHTSEQVEGWKRVVNAVHVAGGRLFFQPWPPCPIFHPPLLAHPAFPHPPP